MMIIQVKANAGGIKSGIIRKFGNSEERLVRLARITPGISLLLLGWLRLRIKKVLEDPVAEKHLKNYYRFVHYDSPDERGIDTALLYQPEFFEVLETKTYPLLLFEEDGSRDYTRDVLMVYGSLKGEKVYLLINHWPSPRAGLELTEPDRIKAANLVADIMNEILAKDEAARFIIMGDFNDNPDNKSIKTLLSKNLFNPMKPLFKKGLGTLPHKKEWHLFDQIILSKSFKKDPKYWVFKKANIYNKEWLRVFKGKLKGSPFRTFIGPWYKGGVSDHFPVFAVFQKRD